MGAARIFHNYRFICILWRISAGAFMDSSPCSDDSVAVRQILTAGKGFHFGAKPVREAAAFLMRGRDASFLGPLPNGGLGTVENGGNFIGAKTGDLIFLVCIMVSYDSER